MVMSKSLNLVLGSLGITLVSIVLLPHLAFAGIPGGSYRRSCANYYIDSNDTLQAMCKDRGGNWRPTSLDNASSCRKAENNNGHLQCRLAVGLPTGSYLQSCGNASTNGNTLSAVCRNQNGNWQPTSLDNFSQCPEGSISNLNGYLTCPR